MTTHLKAQTPAFIDGPPETEETITEALSQTTDPVAQRAPYR